MKKTLKKVISTISAIALAITTSISVNADEFNFDMSKARPTYGGGQSFSTFTRLDGEKRDKNKFSPLWLTEDSTIEITYETSGEYEEAPLNLIFQSWKGGLAESQEDKWIAILPSSFDETHAIFTYEDILKTYGSDTFNDVYAINVSDNKNSLFVKSITATNCNIPDDFASTITGGTVVFDDIIYSEGENGLPIIVESTELTTQEEIVDEHTTVTETTASESDTSETNQLTNETETASAEVSETKAEETTSELREETQSHSITESDKSSNSSSSVTEKSSINPIIIVIICAAVGVIIIALVIVFILFSKKSKGRAYRKFK